MPIYEYECPACGVVEVMQGINDDPLSRCPNCRKRKVRKLISESSFQLKGSGWYSTDYGHGNGNGNGKKDKEEKAPASEKTDSTPAKTDSGSKPTSESKTASAK